MFKNHAKLVISENFFFISFSFVKIEHYNNVQKPCQKFQFEKENADFTPHLVLLPTHSKSLLALLVPSAFFGIAVYIKPFPFPLVFEDAP